MKGCPRPNRVSSAFVAAAMLKQVLVLLAAAQAVDIDYYFGAE